MLVPYGVLLQRASSCGTSQLPLLCSYTLLKLRLQKHRSPVVLCARLHAGSSATPLLLCKPASTCAMLNIVQTTDDSLAPLSINCWPSQSGAESYVNIEYEATTAFDLQTVVIAIPLPAMSHGPRVSQVHALSTL